MPDSPTGVYTLPSGYYVEVGDTAEPSQHNPPLEDIAAALTNRIHADGRTAWTGDQNANGHKITDLAEGTNPNDAVRVAQLSNMGIPVGVWLPYGGSTAPDGWILCDGRAISRSEFAALYAVIGTTFGIGNGSTTFNVPDMRGRVPAGADAMGGNAASRLTSTGLGTSATLGASGGGQTHTLTTAQIPSHNHASGSLATSSAGSHKHGAPMRTESLITGRYGSYGAGGGSYRFQVATNDLGSQPATSTDGAHTHDISGNTGSAGSGSAHPNVQPTLVVNYIIKAV